MKKHYLLALMASVVCGMSAQTRTNVAGIDPSRLGAAAMNQPTSAATDGSAASSTAVRTKAPASLLRSASAQLPDSLIDLNAQGVRFAKNTFKYNDAGQTTEMYYYLWNEAASDWAMEGSTYNTYTYDANGNEIGHIYHEWNGSEYVEKEITTKTYDERDRVLTEDLRIPDDKSISYGGNWNEETGEMDWYEAIVWSYEYDALNRTVASNMENSDKAGNVLNTTDITYEYADEGTWNYTLVQRSKAASEPNPVYIAQKQERKEGNPAIVTTSQQYTEDGPWTVIATNYYYYPGPLTANESIKDSAEPTFEAYVANGALHVTTSEAAAVQVYGVTGVCHYNATVSGNATIANLPKGIYIVKVGGETMKLSVR